MYRNDSRRLTWTVVSLLALVAFVGLSTAGSWSGNEVVKDGVKHVMNPEKSVEKQTSVQLEELWRIGGEDDEEIFGVITDIVVDDDGNVYMLDAQLNEIKVYDTDGEFLRTIGREGEGPGEFRGASNMFMVPGGNIGVLQTFPAKIVVLTPEGEPAGDFPIPEADQSEGFRMLLGAEFAGDNLAITYAFNQPSESGFTQKSVLSLVNKDGKSETRLYDDSSEMNAAQPRIAETEWDTFRNRWTASPDGRAFSCLTFGEYEITVWGADGKIDRVVKRDYPAHARNEEEKERLLGIYKGFTRRIPVPNIQYEIEDNFNPIQTIHAREDGSLWVRTSRGSNGLPDGVFAIFDVFDKQGRFERQVTVKGDGDPLKDGYFLVKDRLYVVTDFLDALMALQGGGGSDDEEEDADEPEPMQVISYSL